MAMATVLMANGTLPGHFLRSLHELAHSVRPGYGEPFAMPLPRRPLAAVPLLASLLACGERGGPPQLPPPTVQVAPVELKDVPVVKSYVGSLDGIVNAEIRARVPGYLASQDY